MKLYHGTSGKVAQRALEVGLLTREDSGADTNWLENPSREDLVYLTVAYAGYFAMSATDEGEKWGIVEVDTDYLDEDDLLPDEDFLEQVARNNDPDPCPLADMEERTRCFKDRLEGFQHHWEDSLGGLGNCAHLGAVPPGAVTRVSILDPKTVTPHIVVAWCDPSIMILNYMLCGGKYRALTKWAFDEVTDSDLKEYMLFGDGPLDGMMKQVVDEYRDVFASREGVEIMSRI